MSADQVVFVGEVVFLLCAVVLVTLYWTSFGKKRVHSLVLGALVLRFLWGLALPLLPDTIEEQAQANVLNLLVLVSTLLLLFVGLYEHLCGEAEESLDERCYELIHAGGLLWLVLWAAEMMTGVRPMEGTHFLGAAAVAILAGTLTRQRPSDLLTFQILSPLVVVVWAGAILADPLMAGYAGESYAEAVAESVVRNANLTFFPTLFFLANLIQKGLVTAVDTRKVVKWVFTCVAASAVYRDPILSPFASRIPAFDTILSSSLGSLSFLGVPLLALQRTRARSRERRD